MTKPSKATTTPGSDELQAAWSRKKSEPTVALALGGGGARGLAHVHIVQALNEMDIKPVVIGGASIGAIMGAAMAAGMSGREIREFTLRTVGTWSEVASRLWSLRPQTMKEMFSRRRGQFGQFDIERILNGFLPEAVPRDFADLQIPLKIVVTDYYGQCEAICETGDLYSAIGASCALPALFIPVKRDGRVLIDGGIYNPVPFDHLAGTADIVVGVDVVGAPSGDPDTVPTRMDALFGANQIMMQSIISLKLKTSPPDVFLRPDVGSFRVMDFNRVAEILDASKKVGDELKTKLDAAIENHIRSRTAAF